MRGVDEFFDRPFLKALRNGVGTFNAVVAIATVLSVVGSAIYLYVVSLPADGQLALLAVAPTVLSIVVSGVTLLASKKLPTVTYKIESLVGTLTVERVGQHHRYTNERVQKIRFAQNGTRLIGIHSYITGSSNSTRVVETTNADHVVLDGAIPEEDGRIHRWIYLGEPYDRGDVTEVGLRQTFEDDASPMRPFYREGGGSHRVKEIVVRLRFDRSQEPAKVEALVWNTNRRPSDRKVVGQLQHERTLDVASGKVEFVLRVGSPKRFYRYGFRWTSDKP